MSAGKGGNVKNALTIVSAVAAYSLLETILLFSLILPRHAGYPIGYPPTNFQFLVVFSQLLLIPGVAAVISWAGNGAHRWLHRTIRILLGGLVAIPAALAFFLIFVAALWLLAWSYEMSRVLFVGLLAIELAAFARGLLLLVRKSGAWGARAEAEKWLAERQKRIDPRERTQRNRAVKFAVCIPVLIVLPIFLFLPETLGLISHLKEPHVADLSGYRVRIPWTWAIQDHRVFASDGRSWISGMAGKGIGRGVNPVRWDSLSGWTFGTKAYDRSDESLYAYSLPPNHTVLSQRVFKFAGEEITCTDYRPSFNYWPNPDTHPTIAHVSCSGPGRFYASMDDGRDEVAPFYEILSTITPSPTRVLSP